MQEPQVGEQVDHLLLVVVVAAGRAERGQPELTERLLVEAGIRAGGEEKDDLAGGGLPRVDELLDPGRDVLRLSVAPMDARVLVGRLVRDEQLDRRAERGILEAPGGRERLEGVAEVGGEQVVDHLQHLGSRAVVLGQREHAAGGLAPLAEDLDVRVPEPVDGLELVPHEEQVFGGEQVDQLALEPVRVLELVHEHGAEAPALALADLGLVAEQVPGGQLQILEVQRGLGGLGRRIRVREAAEQFLEQGAVARGELVESGLLDGTPGLLVGGRTLTLAPAGREVGEVEEPLGMRRPLEELDDAHAGLASRVRSLGVVGEAPCCLAELLDPGIEPRPLRHFQHELAACRAERVVDAREHPPQPARTVRGEQADSLRIAGRAELLERGVERLAGEDSRLVLVEDAEVRVDGGLERMRLQQPVAEAVDGRDPGPVELAGEIVAAELGEAGADAAAQLPGRALGVRDREHRIDRQPPVADRAHEALDENGRLSRPRAGGDEDEPGRVDRRELLGVRRARVLGHGHDRATRHIGHRSHQLGQGNPPFGSCWMSPSRMRSTKRTACSFARSVCAQNSSSAR